MTYANPHCSIQAMRRNRNIKPLSIIAILAAFLCLFISGPAQAATVRDANTGAPIEEAQLQPTLGEGAIGGTSGATTYAHIKFDPLPYVTLRGQEIADFVEGSMNVGSKALCLTLKKVWPILGCEAALAVAKSFIGNEKNPNFDPKACYAWKAFNVPPEKVDNGFCG